MQDRSSAVASSGSYYGVLVDTFRFGAATQSSASYDVTAGTLVLVAANGGLASLGNNRASCIAGANGDFVAAAAANIDSELTGIDTWAISTQSGTLTVSTCSQPNGQIVGGNPIMLYDDVGATETTPVRRVLYAGDVKCHHPCARAKFGHRAARQLA